MAGLRTIALMSPPSARDAPGQRCRASRLLFAVVPPDFRGQLAGLCVRGPGERHRRSDGTEGQASNGGKSGDEKLHGRGRRLGAFEPVATRQSLGWPSCRRLATQSLFENPRVAEDPYVAFLWEPRLLTHRTAVKQALAWPREHAFGVIVPPPQQVRDERVKVSSAHARKGVGCGRESPRLSSICGVADTFRRRPAKASGTPASCCSRRPLGAHAPPLASVAAPARQLARASACTPAQTGRAGALSS